MVNVPAYFITRLQNQKYLSLINLVLGYPIKIIIDYHIQILNEFW